VGKIGGIIGVLTAVALLLSWLFMGLFHAPRPREVPIAVVGTGAAADGLAKALDADPTFAVTQVADGAAARKLIDERKVYGAYAARARSGRVITASAASLPVAGLMQIAFTGVDAKRGVTTVVTDAKPLPAADGGGVTGYFLTLAIVVVAVLGGWWLELVAPSVRRGWQATLGRIGVLALLSLVAGVAFALVASGIGVFDGHFLDVVWTSALTGFGIATVTAFLTSAAGGIVGLIAALSIFVLFGVLATSGGGSAPEFLPDFWKALGTGLPPRSSIELLRNVSYFDGEAIATPLAVLGAYAAAGLAFMLALSPFRRA
jgi:hypothetical protein